VYSAARTVPCRVARSARSFQTKQHSKSTTGRDLFRFVFVGANTMKTRRKKRSKCERTSLSAIEKTPFKDQAENGINFDYCFNPKPPHILMRSDLKCSEVCSHIQIFEKQTRFTHSCACIFQGNYLEQILKTILDINVGVSWKGLLNQDLKRETHQKYLLVELKKLLKQHSRLNIYIQLSFQLAHSSVPYEDIFPRKVVLQILHFIVSHVIPLSLLGSKQNFKLFLKLVKKVVYGSHHQRFSLSSMVGSIMMSHHFYLILFLL